jgi:hypothetical protein
VTVYPASHRSERKKAALTYAKRGIPVLPCAAGSKTPLLDNGHLGASTDPRKINLWWSRWPDANVGFPTGKRSGIFVLDVEEHGFSKLQELEEERGELPATWTVKTGRRGRHYYFKLPEDVEIRNSAGIIGMGLDIRGEGGYVVAPPSRTQEAYEVLERVPIAQPSEWLLETVREPPPKPGRSGGDRDGAPLAVGLDGPEIITGERNQELARIAGRLHDGSRDLEALTADLKAINAARCKPPLPEAEVERVAASIHRREPCASGTSPSPEILELVEELGRWWWGEAFPKVGGKTMASFLRALMREGRRTGTVIPGVGLRVSLSVRAAAEMVGCHRNTILNLTKRGREAGILRKDSSDRGEGNAEAFVLLDPRQTCDIQTISGGEGGVSQPSRAPVAELRTPHYRWRGLIGKGKERALCALEAFGPQTAQELAECLSWSRPRDLRTRYLEPLAELGLIENSGGAWSLPDHRQAKQVRDLPYSTVQLRPRRLYSPTEGRRVTVVVESGVVASESDRERQDREQHEREREAFRRRHENAPDYHYVNAGADGRVEDLRPVEPEESPPEPEVSALARAIRDYLDRSPTAAGEPPGWIGVTLWADDLCDGKPTPSEVRAAIEELGGERYLRSMLRVADGRAA